MGTTVNVMWLLPFPGAIMKHIELTHPSEMSASERAGEITLILATTIVRTQLAGTNEQREVELAITPYQSVHTNPLSRKERLQ
jgi:hypothetical protein